MKAIFIMLVCLCFQAQAQIFQQEKSYELLYVESDFVMQARHIGNKNVIIKKIYRDDDEHLKEGDTIYIGWLSEYEMRDPPEQVFLFLKKINQGMIPAYSTLDAQPASNSGYEQVNGGLIWCDQNVCYRYSYPVQGYMRLKTMYTETQHPVVVEDLHKTLIAFQPYFEKYRATRNLPEDSVKALTLASYLFRESTPATPYYDLFAQLEMKDPAWNTKTFEYSRAMIPYFKTCSDTARLTYPLEVLRRMDGSYNEYVLLRFKDLLKRNTHPEDHMVMIQLMEAKGDYYAKEILRKQYHSRNKQDRALSALMLYSLKDEFYWEKAKKVLLKDKPEYKMLLWLYTIEPEKTRDFIQNVMGNEEKETIPDELLSILNSY